MKRTKPVNEFENRPPNEREMRRALFMARKVSRRLWAMMQARTWRKEQKDAGE